MNPVRTLGAAALLAATFSLPSSAQVTQLVSVNSAGVQSNSDAILASISADGRYVAFVSESNNLVAGDVAFWVDVYVRDRDLGTTDRASVSSGGVVGNQNSFSPSISADGRFVAFSSYASNLVAGDTNGEADIFVRDRQLGTTERVSVGPAGAQGNDECLYPRISADGRFVAFDTRATNLVPGDTNGSSDIFVHDRQLGTTERVSIDTAGSQGDGDSLEPSISSDGRFVAFYSFGENLVAGDTNGWGDVFVRDRTLASTERVSVATGGAQASGPSGSYGVAISGDGQRVVFDSAASDLVPGDIGFHLDVFVRDRTAGTTVRISTDNLGTWGNSNSGVQGVAISGDGRHAAFGTDASNFFGGDTNGSASDIVVHDLLTGVAERVNLNWSGVQGDLYSHLPSLSADGRYVAFHSFSSNLVPADEDSQGDVLVRDRTGGPAFTSLCSPGVGSTIPCPCSNPPSGLGRGCDNSAGTGGATLLASGGTYLSSDTVVFTTSGEKPTALSIVSQWTLDVPNGTVFGQGVRCAAGTLKRLYTKNASGGSITVPNLGAGELQVSVRSAALGDAIVAGQSRWYVVYYRDPIVLGGCPSTSTFNATQTGRLDWSP